ncbi:MAG: succinate dehydrogenase cytochrome b subunit [bacterium]
MLPKSKLVWSSVGKKIIMALTGLAMIIFLLEHLSGNLLLLSKDPDPYNKYAHFLISFGWVIILAELVLVAILAFHVYSGISVAIGKKQARPQAYHKTAAAGGPSKKNLASSTMIYTGVALFIFLVIHLKTFKYGPGIEEGYVAQVEVSGEQVRDLHKLVVDVFQHPGYVIGYVAVMLFLGFHLRHGFWSAFQSLGVNHPRVTPLIYSLGLLVAAVLGVGFLLIPIWIYFTGA